MKNTKVNSINAQIKKLKGRPWHPLQIAEANGQALILALFLGEYHWHKHLKDELFYALSGRITIKLKKRKSLVLNAGEFAVVQKNVWHCPKSTSGAHVLMFEPKNLKNII
jgi:mannose-6-phosphate isomerase-like protein (cupin superfamily)